MRESEFIGRYSKISFCDGLARIDRGVLEPARDNDACYERPTAELVCKYKIVFSKLFDINDFGEDICEYFEKMKYEIQIDEYYDGRTNVFVTDLRIAGIVASSNSLLDILNFYESKRTETISNNI